MATPSTKIHASAMCNGRHAACAGVTMRAFSTSIGMPVEGSVHAEGDLDFRGTLAVDRGAAVGFREIRLRFALESDADEEALAKLIALTERYCVVLQSLQAPSPVAVDWGRAG